MELIAELVNNQLTLYIPVALVLVALTLLFTFGFKPSEQPSFDKLSIVSDDRKAGAKKQRKVKDKKTANGNAISVSETKNEKSKETKHSPTKETPNTPKQTKKQDPQPTKVPEKKKAEVKVKKVDMVEEKNKKNVKVEKPADFDDGNWETVPSKGDKKKKQDSPKKEKKSKIIKEEDNKENKVENVKEEKKHKIQNEEMKEPESEKKEKSVEKESLAPVFDELGDVWAEAKQPRKTKKKSRRDN